MAITYVGGSGANFAASTSAGAPGEPAGSQDGDILLNCLVSETVHDSTGTPPTGWTKIAEVDNASGTTTSLSVFWKRRSGVESATWTSIFAAAENGRAITVGYRGCLESGDPQDVAAVTNTDSATAWDTASITPVTNDVIVVGIIGADPSADPLTFAWDAGITERIDSDTSPTGQNGLAAWIGVADKIVATPAATTFGGDSNQSNNPALMMIVLRPATGVGGAAGNNLTLLGVGT